MGVNNTCAQQQVTADSVLDWIIRAGNHVNELVDSENPDTRCDVDFRFDIGGQVNTGIQYNLESQAYEVGFGVEQFNLGLLLPYATEYLRVNDFQGSFSTAIALSGNANQPEDINSSAELTLDDFSLQAVSQYIRSQ